MKSHKSILALISISGLIFGMTSGCSMKRNLFELDFLKNFHSGVEKANKKRFVLMYKPQLHAEHAISKMHLHPVKLSKEQIRRQIRSLEYREFSLGSKMKPVFPLSEINRMSVLIKKSLSQIPKNKIVFYALETPSGPTEGILFASANILHWKFFSIKGENFSKYPRPTWGAWSLVPGPGQKYHAVHKISRSEVLENWIEVSLPVRTRESRVESPPLSIKRKSHQTASRATDTDRKNKLDLQTNLYKKK